MWFKKNEKTQLVGERWTEATICCGCANKRNFGGGGGGCALESNPHPKPTGYVRKDINSKSNESGASLVVQWLRLQTPKQSEVAQSCPTLWDPMDCSPPGSSVHGIL